MSIIFLEKNTEIERLINICKSDSQTTGVSLRDAHYELGSKLAEIIAEKTQAKGITLIIMMRAGLCFGMGIANMLERLGKDVVILFYCNEKQWKKEKNNCPKALNNNILLVDAVINTGDEILKFASSLPYSGEISFATNVIPEKVVKRFDCMNLYTIRVSQNIFKGSKSQIIKNGKGPDTGDRLFKTV
jgi:uracil phosphoribosyltransferase